MTASGKSTEFVENKVRHTLINNRNLCEIPNNLWRKRRDKSWEIMRTSAEIDRICEEKGETKADKTWGRLGNRPNLWRKKARRKLRTNDKLCEADRICGENAESKADKLIRICREMFALAERRFAIFFWMLIKQRQVGRTWRQFVMFSREFISCGDRTHRIVSFASSSRYSNDRVGYRIDFV